MDIASLIFLLIWPVLPLAFMVWGFMDAQSAQRVIDSLQKTTMGTVTQSLTYTNRIEGTYQEDDEFEGVLSIRLDYEVDGKTYQGGRFSPGDVVPWSELSSGGYEEIVGKYQEGETYPVWYNPDNPSRAYLVKGSKWDHARKFKWGAYIFLGIGVLLGMLLTLSKFSK